MSRFFSLFSLLFAFCFAGHAAADPPRLLLAGDDSRLDAFAEVLQVELAGEGWQVLRTEGVTGDTALQRASEAQRMARRAGARTRPSGSKRGRRPASSSG